MENRGDLHVSDLVSERRTLFSRGEKAANLDQLERCWPESDKPDRSGHQGEGKEGTSNGVTVERLHAGIITMLSVRLIHYHLRRSKRYSRSASSYHLTRYQQQSLARLPVSSLTAERRIHLSRTPQRRPRDSISKSKS